MKELRQHIKDNRFNKVYLLTGDEDYLLNQARNLLLHALVREGDQMNCLVIENSKIDFRELEDFSMTYPFFADKRVIILDRTGVIRSGKDQFAALLKRLPDTTCMIICEGEVDRRSAAYRWIKKNECVKEFLKKSQTEKMLLRWIAALLGKENKRIREKDAAYLIERTGTDMYQLSNEVAKLISYTGSAQEISRQDIEAICSGEIQSKIWDLVSYITAGDKQMALHTFQELAALREPFMRILFLIIREYRILLIISEMDDCHKSDSEIAKTAGIPVFALRRTWSRLKDYTTEDLEYCISRCVQMEEEIKSGRIQERTGLEYLIIGLSER